MRMTAILALILAVGLGQGVAAQVSETDTERTWREAEELARVFGALGFVEERTIDRETGELLSRKVVSVRIDHEKLKLDLVFQFCVRKTEQEDCSVGPFQRCTTKNGKEECTRSNAFWVAVEAPFAKLDPKLSEYAQILRPSSGLDEFEDFLVLECAGSRDCLAYTDIESNETSLEDYIELKCKDSASCEAAAETVATLIARAQPHAEPPPKPQPQPRPSPDIGAGIAGTWGLFPIQPGVGSPVWMLYFGADGVYSFSDLRTGARHAGRYTAADGGWSMSGQWENRNGVPASMPQYYTDGGRYRLLAPDLLELGGQFGIAVWARMQ